MTSNTAPAPEPKPAEQHRRRWRFGVALAATTVVAAAATGTVSPAAAAPNAGVAPTAGVAADCVHQTFGLIPSSTPWQDMALGYDFVNQTSHNAPVGLRDSKALSRAELWIELDGPGTLVYLQNVNTDAGTFAVSRGDFGNPTIVTKHLNGNDSRQRWQKEQNGSWVKYKDPNSGKYITYVPGNSAKPFELTTGNGDINFKVQPGGCYEFPE